MICEKCGAEFDDELQFCPNCDEGGDEAEELVIPEETVEAEDVEETVDVDEATDTEESGGTEEYSEDELTLVEEDEALSFDNPAKMPKAFKVIAIVVAVIVALFAACGVFYGLVRPDIDSPVAGWFDDGKDTTPLIYTKKVNGTYGLYVGENQLADFGSKAERFVVNTDFIFNEDNVYYIVNNALYWYDIGSKAPVKVADSADKSSIVLSANGKRILFTATADGQTTLYSYIKGKKAKEVAVLPCAKNAFDLPHYGFVGSSSEFWYINAENETDNGELYVSSVLGGPKLKYQEIGSVVYYSSEYAAVVYTLNAGPDIRLYATIGKNEPILMAENINSVLSPVIVNAPSEGVAYVGYGNGITNTLFFQPFDGTEAKTIDTGVSAAISVWETQDSEQAYYDYSKFIKKTDALYYIKGTDILISRGANPGQKPINFNYYTSSPVFSDDSNKLAYLADNSTLMLATYDGTSWPTASKIAENVNYFSMSGDGEYISFLQGNATDGMTSNLYNVATGHVQQLSSTPASEVVFVPDIPKTVVFASDYNTETQALTLNYYQDGGAVTPMDSDITGFAQLTDGTPIFAKTNAADENLIDLYVLDSNFNLVPVATAIYNINSL